MTSYYAFLYHKATMTTTPQQPEQDDVMTVEEVSELLHLHPDTVLRKAHAEEIPGMFRIGENEKAPIRFSKRIIMEWIQKEASRP